MMVELTQAPLVQGPNVSNLSIVPQMPWKGSIKTKKRDLNDLGGIVGQELSSTLALERMRTDEPT